MNNVVTIRQETIRPIYSNGKIFAAFTYEIFDTINNIVDKHEKHLLLQDVDSLPLPDLIQLCLSATEEYRVNLQESINNGSN